eukprot:snap_masked-scaffold_3-processed-gene-1.35-mRNA-1 protein AED:1.00 eAED:1.00 QI:0/0/0/0/1/1/2/0/161
MTSLVPTSLDEAINYFVKVQSTFELRFNEQQNVTETSEISVNKARLNKHRNSKQIRCRQCTGYGHVKKQCTSNEEHCFRYGGTDHKCKNCKSKLVRIKTMDVIEEVFKQYFHTSENNNRPENSENVQSQYEQEVGTSFYYMLRIQYPKIILKTKLFEEKKM